jgi:diaminopimelate decarboxylase
MKANSSLAVLQVFARAGCGFDIVSGGELERVLAAGGKRGHHLLRRRQDPRRNAPRAGSRHPLLQRRERSRARGAERGGAGAGQAAPVSLRVNPDVDPKTHPYISTGLKGNKFGIAHKDALRLPARGGIARAAVVGIDCHIGSQITFMSPYLDAMDRVLDLVESVDRSPASRWSTSTSAAAWASTTTASSRPTPTRCGSSCWPSSMRAATASAS